MYTYTYIISVGASFKPWSHFEKKLICFKIQMHQSLGEVHGFISHKMGLSGNRVYSQWNSHLIGIMISKTIGFRGLAYFQTHPNGFNPAVESRIQASNSTWNVPRTTAQRWPPSVSATRGHKVLIVTSLVWKAYERYIYMYRYIYISLDKASHKT